MSVYPRTEMRIVYGAEIEVRDCYVADCTHKMQLVLYNKHIHADQTDKSYSITSISTRKTNNALFLITTKATVFKDCHNIHVPTRVALIVEQPQQTLTTLTGNTTCVKLDDNRQCVC